jgi:hypothetical protein
MSMEEEYEKFDFVRRCMELKQLINLLCMMESSNRVIIAVLIDSMVTLTKKEYRSKEAFEQTIDAMRKMFEEEDENALS